MAKLVTWKPLYLPWGSDDPHRRVHKVNVEASRIIKIGDKETDIPTLNLIAVAEPDRRLGQVQLSYNEVDELIEGLSKVQAQHAEAAAEATEK